jgi:hypothetical protein
MVDKIRHIFIVLVLPTKSVLKHWKHAVHNIHRLVWGAYARGAPSYKYLQWLFYLYIVPHQVMWVTFSTWFQWSPIPIIRQSFSRNISLWKSVIFTNNQTFSSIFTCKNLSCPVDIYRSQSETSKQINHYTLIQGRLNSFIGPREK